MISKAAAAAHFAGTEAANRNFLARRNKTN
jgi:hypothetical protein